MGSAIFFCVLPLTLLDAGVKRPFYLFGLIPPPQKNWKVADLFLLLSDYEYGEVQNTFCVYILPLVARGGPRKKNPDFYKWEL